MSTHYFTALQNVGRVKSFVDDLFTERGTVSMRVALVLRSVEVHPLFRGLCEPFYRSWPTTPPPLDPPLHNCTLCATVGAMLQRSNKRTAEATVHTQQPTIHHLVFNKVKQTAESTHILFCQVQPKTMHSDKHSTTNHSFHIHFNQQSRFRKQW